MTDPIKPPFVHLADYEPVPTDVLELLTSEFVRHKLIAPLELDGDTLVVAVPRTTGIIKPEGVELIVKHSVRYVVASVDDILKFISKHYPDEVAPETGSAHTEPASAAPTAPSPSTDFDSLDDVVHTTGLVLDPVLEKVLVDAQINRATDVYLTKEAAEVRFRERVRGNVINAARHFSLSGEEAGAIFAWVKQNGRKHAHGDVKWVELRAVFDIKGEMYVVQFLFSVLGVRESLTVRLRSRKTMVFSPSSWGMDPVQSHSFGEMIERRSGLVLFCGLDSSSVDTQLAATVSLLATPNRRVIAVTDYPRGWNSEIEEFISGGHPAATSDLLALGFRHGPDYLIGTPLTKRDHFVLCAEEAMKGRVVFGRMYALDASEGFAQLMRLGVPPALLAGALLGVVATQSFRINCSQCLTEDTQARSLAKELDIPIPMQPPKFFKGRGCENCQHTGFDGEADLFEVVPMTDDLRTLLKPDLKADDLRRFLKQKGLVSFRQAAIRKAINGQTSLLEVVRSTLR